MAKILIALGNGSMPKNMASELYGPLTSDSREVLIGMDTSLGDTYICEYPTFKPEIVELSENEPDPNIPRRNWWDRKSQQSIPGRRKNKKRRR